ncbi:hypothetical protein C0J52_13142 [Blattella germanica]|nr:hypothetical protein C0J52_13142 [Blattella germanica]
MELSRASNSNNKGAGSMVCETSEDCKCLVSAVLDTVLRMTASLAVLQNKCRTKDRMIQSLADELNGRSLSGVFDNLLTNLALDDSAFPTQPYDFDRIRLCEYLKKPTGFSRNSMQSTQQCIAPCPRIERFSPFDNTRMLALEDRYGTDVLMIPCKAPCSMKRSNVDDFTSEYPLTSSAKEYSNPSVRSGDINPYADCIPKEMTSANEIRDNSFCTDNQTYSGYGTQNVPANLETDPNIPPPMDIEVLHLTSIEALLISWRPPRIQDLHGYEQYEIAILRHGPSSKSHHSSKHF